jgi:hypothetical protein
MREVVIPLDYKTNNNAHVRRRVYGTQSQLRRSSRIRPAERKTRQLTV